MRSFRLERTSGETRATSWLWLAGILAWCAIPLWLGAAAWLLLTIIWAIPVLLAANIGRKKNRGGFWWGLLLGWLGVAIVACLGRIPTAEELALERQHRELQIRMLQQQPPA